MKRLRTAFTRAHERLKPRRPPATHRFSIAEGIDGLRGDHWDELTAGHSVCLSRPFLRLLESAGPHGLKMHYAIAYEAARPVAAIACQSLAVDASSVPSRKGKENRVTRLRDQSLRQVQERVLVCGNLLGWGFQGVAFARGIDPALAWPAVAEALYRIRRQDVLFGETGLVLVKDLGADEGSADSPLRGQRYGRIDTEPNMVLALRPEWKTFDDYLAAMKSDYRSGIKKQMRDVEAAGVRLERLDAAGVRAAADAIHGLYLEVHERQKLRLVTISPEWIPALASEFREGFRTSVLRTVDGALVGFVTSLRDRDGAIGYYIGFDKTLAATGVPLYLRLLYALVEDALALGAAWISLGRTALEPKAKLGAAPHPLRCYVRHRVPAMNAVLGALLRVAPEPDEAPERRPFKPPKPAAV